MSSVFRNSDTDFALKHDWHSSNTSSTEAMIYFTPMKWPPKTLHPSVNTPVKTFLPPLLHRTAVTLTDFQQGWCIITKRKLSKRWLIIIFWTSAAPTRKKEECSLLHLQPTNRIQFGGFWKIWIGFFEVADLFLYYSWTPVDGVYAEWLFS